MDMYSDSGDDTADGKPLDEDTNEEQADKKWDKKAKEMKAHVNTVDADDVAVSVEDEPMSDAESEHNDQCYEVMDADDRALIKEEKPVGQTAKEKENHSSPQEQPKLPEVIESSKEIIIIVFFINSKQSYVTCTVTPLDIINHKSDEPLIFVWYHVHGTTDINIIS